MDQHLIERCRTGETVAVERFVQIYQRDVYRLALSILDDSNEAEDATQEVLLAALRALDTFHGVSSLKTWLFSITINLCRTRLRQRNRRELLNEILGGILRFHTERSPSVEERTIQNEAGEAFWSAIQNLKEKHRIPIVLRYYQNLSVAEIATILQIPEGTVHSRLNTARRKLQAVLKEGSS